MLHAFIEGMILPLRWCYKLVSVDRKVTTKSDEVVPGVSKPTLIMVDMIVAEMLQHPEKFKIIADIKGYSQNTMSLTWTNKLFHIQYKIVSCSKEKRSSVQLSRLDHGHRGWEIVLQPNELNRLRKGCDDAYELYVALQANKAEADRQQTALDLIEKMLLK